MSDVARSLHEMWDDAQMLQYRLPAIGEQVGEFGMELIAMRESLCLFQIAASRLAAEVEHD
ncbi:hypothetical protein JRG19_02415 [Pseudoclavibacter alba]|uniref:Uncharacterized protein n=1 Tax=Pseudoclavibacter albus TaxID=272241 RepID=A0ABT2HWE5_9MICO|nr:hypothetical protein [Pseudoclavibacter alba]MBN6777404.1 hypothetical protein [Pseudoclavibacter alba]MCT2042639.1 hypothetical protein [Pseudoclavibacter alba]